jgi:ABC-type multidrug transport system fused ATPase/permease subunit
MATTPSTEGQWPLKDTHQENISFSQVVPVDVRIRGVSVGILPSRRLSGRLWSASPAKSSTKGDLEVGNVHSKFILDRVSADFPKGSLCGIMGASGSGKVCLLNNLHRCQR